MLAPRPYELDDEIVIDDALLEFDIAEHRGDAELAAWARNYGRAMAHALQDTIHKNESLIKARRKRP